MYKIPSAVNLAIKLITSTHGAARETDKHELYLEAISFKTSSYFSVNKKKADMRKHAEMCANIHTHSEP